MQITAHKVTAYQDSQGNEYTTRREAEDAEFRIALGRLVRGADLLPSDEHRVCNFITAHRHALRKLLTETCTVVEET